MCTPQPTAEQLNQEAFAMLEAGTPCLVAAAYFCVDKTTVYARARRHRARLKEEQWAAENPRKAALKAAGKALYRARVEKNKAERALQEAIWNHNHLSRTVNGDGWWPPPS